jgi:hypothetical protein
MFVSPGKRRPIGQKENSLMLPYRLMAVRTAIASAVLLTGMHPVVSAQTGPVDDNLIEYSMGPYSDVGPRIP